MKNAFDYGNIYLTGDNGGTVVLHPTDILLLKEEDGGTIVTLAKAGVKAEVKVKQTPGRIKQKVNNLARKQEIQQRMMEAEAKAKAQESFFSKFPKTKAMFQEESAELNKRK